MLSDLEPHYLVLWVHLRCVTHRFPEGLQDLSAEDVEVVCRSGAVHHDPVTVVQLMHCEVLSDFLWEKVELQFRAKVELITKETCSHLFIFFVFSFFPGRIILFILELP